MWIRILGGSNGLPDAGHFGRDWNCGNPSCGGSTATMAGDDRLMATNGTRRPKKVGRRDLQTALENLMFSLALYAAGKGSVAEKYLTEELDKMAVSILKTVSPEGMLQLQAALGKLLEIEAAKLDA